MARLPLVLACAGAIAVGGCGSDASSDSRVTVVATTGIVADLVERVGGEEVEVVQLVPEGASPHDFALSARDRQALEEADLVVANGAGLEAGIPLDGADAPRWELTENAGPLIEGDPHVWMDPTRTARALASLAAALGEADPERASAYEQRAREHASELRALDRELERTLASIPKSDRELVTSHDALGYLADRYELEVVATAFPASGADAEATPSALADVIEAIEEHDVAAVFAEEGDDPAVMRRIAESAGVEVVDDLLVESPGSAGSYEAMLRHDAELIAKGLAGNSS